jgi:putative membrane-bound dehydrogenase-like protein
MKLRPVILLAVCTTPFAFLQTDTAAQDKKKPKDVIPHGQSSMPGPPLSPQEALKKMQVPPGFHVELVVAEPDIVNPVAMTFDERGRIWITESLEYPRKSPGPGQDRVKVLESTKGDGKFDRITTVIDGLNIPSGIAIGHGGVWLANAPDILYYPFEDFANLKVAKPIVVVTGFGRADTHELPNCLTWGPDGLNGVFNRSVIKQDGRTFDFTCALFRIHPKTKKFEIFCEGTSNPWGLAINENGDFFVSACVIDHLWHLTETGYYHRQGGAYPPYTWKIGSIVKHKHQKAAYCGLVWFDSDAYPPLYREKLYMGNIHGNAINCDYLEKDGSTYFAKPALTSRMQGAGVTPSGVGEGSNFLLANDAWFMPVAQKVGPDGCLYILDWYDRYHCYQDANRDPGGIDRLKGRLYRIVYKDHKPAATFDLNAESDKKLIERLDHPNIFYRETSQRILSERRRAYYDIAHVARNGSFPRRARLHAIWSLMGGEQIGGVGSDVMGELLRDGDPTVRAWAVRAVGNAGRIAPFVKERTKDKSPDVLLQVAIATPKIKTIDALPVFVKILESCGDDKLIPHIVWQNMHPFLYKEGDRFLELISNIDLAKAPGLAKVLPHAIDRIIGNFYGDPSVVVKFIEKVTAANQADPMAKLCLTSLSIKIQNNELAGKQLDGLKKELTPMLRRMIADRAPLHLEAAVLGAALRDMEALQALRQKFGATEQTEETLLTILDALTAANDASILDSVGAGLADPKSGSPQGRARTVAALARLDDPRVASVVLGAFPKMEPELQPKAIELMTQRSIWAKPLFRDIAAKKISKDVVNVNQARRLLATKDKELMQLVEKHWGIPRDGRNPEREKLVSQYRELYAKTPGDPKAGVAHFKKVCAQCHKMYGEGVDVGPDITANGRADFDQLLSNIFDPSLVIGAGYQAVSVHTKQGQVISGLIVEDNAQRVVLKVQGGELKTIARKDVDEQHTSKLSMMPEDLEKQLRPQEIVDLLAYLSLDRPPDDAKAKRIPGTPR